MPATSPPDRIAGGDRGGGAAPRPTDRGQHVLPPAGGDVGGLGGPDPRAGRWLSGLPAPARYTATGDAPRPDAPGPPGPPHQRAPHDPHGPLAPARPRRALSRTGWLVLALGILGLCGLVGEGAAGDWSAVYLHDNLIAAAGLAGGLLSHSIAGALAGFAVLGAGLSCVVPQVFSAGGRADPVRPGRGLARVVGLGYLGLAAGPVVIGRVPA